MSITIKNTKIQALRAIAIIAVVIIHTWGSIYIRPLVNFCVALFIFLSGYLTKISTPPKISVRRITRTLIPYLIWSVMFIVAGGYYKNPLYSIFLIATFQSCSIYYYIAVYLQFVLFTPLIVKLLKSKYCAVGFFISPAAIIVEYILVFIGKPLNFPWNGNLLFVWFIYYYLGLFLKNKDFNLNLKFKSVLLLYGCSLISQYAEAFIWNLQDNFNMATTQIKLSSMFTSVMTCIILFYFINTENFKYENNRLYKFLISIGNASFGIYLSHILVMQVLNRIPIYGQLFSPLKSILVFAVTYICVIIGNKILGKNSKYLGLN